MKTEITILFVLGILLTVASSCGSSRHFHTEATHIQDTVFVTKDSIVIQERIVEVEVPVPVTDIERVVPADTASVIDNGLFTSTASVQDGMLHHTLRSNPRATVTGSAAVRDTTKTSDKYLNIYVNDQEQRTDTVYTNVLTVPQKVFVCVGKGTLGILFAAILIFLGRFYLKKRGLLK